MASGEGDGGNDQKILKDLLKMSLKLTDSETKTFEPTQMDKEREEFLRKAIEHALENDDGKKLILFTKLFFEYKHDEDMSETKLNDLYSIFEELQFLIEGMDMAKDFNKLGGLIHCLSFLKSKQTSLQWRAADLIANCAQNNPSCQSSLLQNNCMELLLYTLKNSIEDLVRIKCVYALSNLIGGCENAESLFIKLHGISTLLGLVKQSNLKLKLKTVFLLKKLLTKDENLYMKENVTVYDKLMESLLENHDDTHEIISEIILFLLENDKTTLDRALNNYEHIIDVLNKRVYYLIDKDKEKYEEEIASCKSILKLLHTSKLR